MSQKHFKTLGKDFVIYGLMASLSRGAGIILLPIFTRIFSTAEYGTIDIIATYTSLLSVFLLLQLPTAFARYFNEKTIKTNILYTSQLLLISTLGILVTSIIYLLSYRVSIILFETNEYSIFVLLGTLTAWFMSFNQLTDQVLRMNRKIILFNALNIISVVLYMIIALTGVFVFKHGLLAIFYGQLIAAIIHFTLGLIINRDYITYKIDLGYLKRSMKYSGPLIPGAIVYWANKQMSRIILLAFIGLSAVGVLGAGTRIASVISLLVGIFRYSWTPLSMEMIYNEDRSIVYKKAVKYYVGIFAAIGLVLIAFSPDILRIITPSEYHHAYIVIPWLVGAHILHGVGPMVNIGAMIREKTFIGSVAGFTGFIVNLTISIPLILLFGLFGAAFGNFIAELISRIMLYRNTIRHTEIKFDTSVIISIIIIFVTSSILIIAVEYYSTMQIMSLVSRIGILTGAIYFIYTKVYDEYAREGVHKLVMILKNKFLSYNTKLSKKTKIEEKL